MKKKFKMFEVHIKQSQVNSTIHYTSDWLNYDQYQIEILTKDKIQLLNKPIIYWLNMPSPAFANSEKFTASYLFSNSEKFSASNLFSLSDIFSISEKFEKTNQFLNSDK